MLLWSTLVPASYALVKWCSSGGMSDSNSMVLFNAWWITHVIHWSIIRFLTHACSQVDNDLHGHVLVIESGLMVTIQHITIPHGMHWSSDVLLMAWATLIWWFYSTYDRSRMASTAQSFAFLLMPALKWEMTCTVMLLWSNLVWWWPFNVSRSHIVRTGQVMFFWWDERP